MSFVQATTTAEALVALDSGARPIAGGTDLVVAARQRRGPLPPHLVAIDRIPDLSHITATATETTIGAAVTHARLMGDPTIIEHHTALADAAALIGSPATRNVGTIGGNVMNASPAMDTGAALMVLGTKVELSSVDGHRYVDLGDLWDGPGTTTAAPNELCTALFVSNQSASEQSGSSYVRLEYRRAMEIAVVGAAAWVAIVNDKLEAIRVALSAVAPTIVEVDQLEACMGLPVVTTEHRADLQRRVAASARKKASPISDLRASSKYRDHTIGVVASRALGAAIGRAQGETIAVPVNRAIGVGAAQ